MPYNYGGAVTPAGAGKQQQQNAAKLAQMGFSNIGGGGVAKPPRSSPQAGYDQQYAQKQVQDAMSGVVSSFQQQQGRKPSNKELNDALTAQYASGQLMPAHMVSSARQSIPMWQSQLQKAKPGSPAADQLQRAIDQAMEIANKGGFQSNADSAAWRRKYSDWQAEKLSRPSGGDMVTTPGFRDEDGDERPDQMPPNADMQYGDMPYRPMRPNGQPYDDDPRIAFGQRRQDERPSNQNPFGSQQNFPGQGMPQLQGFPDPYGAGQAPYRPGQASPMQQPSQGTPYGSSAAPAGWRKETFKPGSRSEMVKWVGPGGQSYAADGAWNPNIPVAPWDQRPPSQQPSQGSPYGAWQSGGGLQGQQQQSSQFGFQGGSSLPQTLQQYAPQSMYQPQYGQPGSFTQQNAYQTPGFAFGGGQYSNQMPAQQMYGQSMNAWTMPKQDLMQWGQQQPVMPTPPQQSNPYSLNVSGQFGNNLSDMWGNMGGFVQGVNDRAAQKPVGTYLGQGNPGPSYAKVNYNIPGLLQQGQQMVQGGWQNPFAMF